MRLLTPKQRESAFKEDRDFEKRKAIELSQEITELTKSFNRTKNELEKAKERLSKEHQELYEDLEKDRKKLEKEIRELEEKRDKAMEPLYTKEKILQIKGDSLDKKEKELADQETGLRVWEKDLKKLEATCNSVLVLVEAKEANLIQREKHIKDRWEQLERMKVVNEKLLKQSKQKIRDWLEKERAQIRKQ